MGDVLLEVNNKPTIGEEAYNRLISGDKQEVGETSSAMNKTFEEELMECIHSYQKKRLENVKPFYMVVLSKKERIMNNVVRRYFFGRESEPTPDYDQTVFKVNPKDQRIDYKWTIPDIETYHKMIFFGHNYPLEEQQLVEFCKAMNENRLADYQRIKVIIE
jgi:hypothetical protein